MSESRPKPMIHCFSDDLGIKRKYVDLCKSIISESGLKGISDVVMDARMKEGYFIISADMKEAPEPSRLADCGRIEILDEGLVLHINPSHEGKLPSIMKVLVTRYGVQGVTAISRNEIKMPNDDMETVSALALEDHGNRRIEVVGNLLIQILPEGFRVMRSRRDGSRLTILCSPYALKSEWVAKLDEMHSRQP